VWTEPIEPRPKLLGGPGPSGSRVRHPHFVSFWDPGARGLPQSSGMFPAQESFFRMGRKNVLQYLRRRRHGTASKRKAGGSGHDQTAPWAVLLDWVRGTAERAGGEYAYWGVDHPIYAPLGYGDREPAAVGGLQRSWYRDSHGTIEEPSEVGRDRAEASRVPRPGIVPEGGKNRAECASPGDAEEESRGPTEGHPRSYQGHRKGEEAIPKVASASLESAPLRPGHLSKQSWDTRQGLPCERRYFVGLAAPGSGRWTTPQVSPPPSGITHQDRVISPEGVAALSLLAPLSIGTPRCTNREPWGLSLRAPTHVHYHRPYSVCPHSDHFRQPVMQPTARSISESISATPNRIAAIISVDRVA